MSLMEIQVPQGCYPGSLVTFQTPDGAQFQAQVPAGVMPGMTFQAQIPAAEPAPLQNLRTSRRRRSVMPAGGDYEVPIIYKNDSNDTMWTTVRKTAANTNALAQIAATKIKEVDAIAKRNNRGEVPVLQDMLVTMNQLSDAARANCLAMQVTKPDYVTEAEWDEAKQAQWQIAAEATKIIVALRKTANRSEEVVRLAHQEVKNKTELWNSGGGTVVLSASIGALIGLTCKAGGLRIGGPAALAAVAAVGIMRLAPGLETYRNFCESTALPHNAFSKNKFSTWMPAQGFDLPTLAVLYESFPFNVYYVLFDNEDVAMDYFHNGFSALGNTRCLCSYDPITRYVFCELETLGLNRMAHSPLRAAYTKEQFPRDHEISDAARHLNDSKAPQSYLEWRR
eukprot:NODE_7032_length_1615_cov_11.231855.p1 GENE.NODE_7032_length_1615_cov_11.231855~~NODE_7032_length_1615_cov_11.231855.p1  ORF type:complete len:395 (+),score=16.56 NODE_7032_length_1615_cov_11.231855:105-1289(+)